MSDTNDERLTVAVRARCVAEDGEECDYPKCGCTMQPEKMKRAIAALNAHDRAQAWGPEAREAMARDAAQALRGVHVARWASDRHPVLTWDELSRDIQATLIADASAAVDAVLRHVRGPLPAEVTEEMVNVYIETMWPDRSALQPPEVADQRAQVRIGLTAALAAASKPDQPSAEARDILVDILTANESDDDALLVNAMKRANDFLCGDVALKADQPSAEVTSAIEAGAKEAVQAHEYLSGLLTHFAPQCKPLADLYGLCTQIDNLLVGMAAPKPDRPSDTDVTRLVEAAASVWLHPRSDIRCPLPGHEMVPDTLLDELAACLGAFEPGPDGSWGDAAAARQHSQPDRPTPPPPSSARPENGSETMADALKVIAALRNEWGGGTPGKAAQAIHTILSTLVVEREAQARRDERLRAAAKTIGHELYQRSLADTEAMHAALSALAAALGEDGR